MKSGRKRILVLTNRFPFLSLTFSYKKGGKKTDSAKIENYFEKAMRLLVC